MSEFSFSKASYQPSSGTASNTTGYNEQSNNLTGADPDPMELVVQSVIGQSLDSAYHNLQTLHESQIVLIARIKILEEKMKRYREILKKSDQLFKKGTGSTATDHERGDLQECEQLVSLIRSKLQGINEKIGLIERRMGVTRSTGEGEAWTGQQWDVEGVELDSDEGQECNGEDRYDDVTPLNWFNDSELFTRDRFDQVVYRFDKLLGILSNWNFNGTAGDW
ncbi:hypothetical protein WICPIJ_005033 [Wickerhamomyces pijperi]|uniref:Uncharacterized protein n=1 Tax=Wickerhamomyces pijperi TaxID=599730 RepID=A0A9P8Q6S4_WICPI|nr:hypothetical protein WICPIJ_005033 [Wickerhamomyces pijperi]